MQDADTRQDMYMEFYEEVCKRTAQLVAGWQCVGFCHGESASHMHSWTWSAPVCGRQASCLKYPCSHSVRQRMHAGVLNTDNMSILGLTIDYGPYGFMDRYIFCHYSVNTLMGKPAPPLPVA